MRKTVVELIDDLDEKVAPDVTTHTFSLDGTEYEIDLNPANARKLSKALEKFCDKGRVTRRPRGSRLSSNGRNGNGNGHSPESTVELTRAARAWALENGYDVAPRGRVPGSVLTAYLAAK